MKPSQITHQTHHVSLTSTYSGPVPDPDSLAKYEHIKEGFAERFITMAEKEQSDRNILSSLAIENDRIAINNDRDIEMAKIANYGRGQIFAIIAVVCALAFCAYIFRLGYPTQGAAVAGVIVVGIAAAFLTDNFKTNKSPK